MTTPSRSSALASAVSSLARVLHVHGIPVTVYEAERLTDRAHPGRHARHPPLERPTGARGSRADRGVPRPRPGRAASPTGSSTGTGPCCSTCPTTARATRPEVQRGELRQLLLDSLPDGTVRWGHKVTGVRALDEGRHEVRFADGTAVVASLLVGADGAWSRVRPLLSDATPEYVGVSTVETFLFDGDTRHPAAADAVGGGSHVRARPGQGHPGPPRERRDPSHLRAAVEAAGLARRHRLHRRRRRDRAGRRGVRRLGPGAHRPPHRQRHPAGPAPASTPCRSGTAGTGRPGSPCSATPPTSRPRTAKAPTSPCTTAPSSAWPSPRTPTTSRPRSPTTSRPCSPAPPPRTTTTTTSTRSCSADDAPRSMVDFFAGAEQAS